MLREAPALGFDEDQKPYIEVLSGRRIPKVSPKRRHGVLQSELGAIMRVWARGRGDVATEWRFYFLGDDGSVDSFLPDVACMSYARVPKSTPEALREKPTIAPDLAIEILSPGDDRRVLEEKIAIYLAFGSSVVLVVDPDERILDAVDATGRRKLAEGETFEDDRFPGLAIDVAALFAPAD